MDTLLLPDAFYLVLEDSPGDETTLCALADWHAERGELATASCVRWTIRRGLYPRRFSRADVHQMAVQGTSWNDGWYWWILDEPNWAEESAGRLPAELWNRLEHTFDYEPAVFKEYPTRRAAYEALFDAWPMFALNNRLVRAWEVAR